MASITLRCGLAGGGDSGFAFGDAVHGFDVFEVRELAQQRVQVVEGGDLRGERDQVRQRVERLLSQLDALEL